MQSSCVGQPGHRQRLAFLALSSTIIALLRKAVGRHFSAEHIALECERPSSGIPDSLPGQTRHGPRRTPALVRG
jgi:hypothetical protein